MQVGCTHDDATGQGRGRPASDMLISSAMLMVEWLGPPYYIPAARTAAPTTVSR